MWLIKEKVSPIMIEVYVRLTRLCVQSSVIQFRDKFYQQNYGVAMGNPISSFLANLFMSALETEMAQHKTFPRIWHRYVDDVFAVVNKRKLNATLEFINSQYESIKFTVEEEQDEKLNFLEITISRNEGRFEYNIYRKPTFIPRYITQDSQHSEQHKKAAFNAMVYRMLHIPMSDENANIEQNKIYEIANINGYEKQWVDKIIRRMKQKRNRRNLTTLYEIENPRRQICAIPFYKNISHKIQRILQQYNINTVTRPIKKLRHEICNYKDKVEKIEKSGIYEIECDECPASYVGQTKRSIKTRFKEHQAATRNNNTEISAVAKHMNENDHHFSINNLRLVREINDQRKMDVIESIKIQTTKTKRRIMNDDDGPIKSSLFNFLIEIDNNE